MAMAMPEFFVRKSGRVPGGDDLDPIAVGVGNKVNAHCGVFKADAAHLPVVPVGRLVIIRPQGQVEFTLAQVILLGVIPQPGQFQAKIRLSVAQKDDDEAAVLRLFPADRLQAQGILVKLQGFFQI